MGWASCLPIRSPLSIPAIQPFLHNQQTFDIYSRLLRERIVFLKGELTEKTANLIVAQLLFLEAEDLEKDISLFINSEGGSATAAITVYDAMQQLRTDISTVCVGTAAVMGVLLASGTKGKDMVYHTPELDCSNRQEMLRELMLS